MPSKSDPQKHHRHSIRIKRYDYASPGAYFITIVTHHRECLFGKVRNGEMNLFNYGKIVDEFWRAIPDHFSHVELGMYVIMPNHVHGITVINDGSRGTIYRAPTEQFGKPVVGSIPTIVRTFKAAVTRHIDRELSSTGIWQRNYYEHIIRDEREWNNIHLYIENNPTNWTDDEENPSRKLSNQ